jgi:polyphosphate kinase 2 (PPK2 family)
MKLASVVARARKLSRPYRITDGERFRLKEIDPGDTGSFRSGEKDDAEALLAEGVAALAEWQERLYAADRWSALFLFQAMDAAGKDGAIKHVMSGVNPQGCQVASFKAPSAEELDHDQRDRGLAIDRGEGAGHLALRAPQHVSPCGRG